MAFIELQSEDHRDLLDAFDRLRAGGICKQAHLPEIIVCGGRSAGKSSVLEAISGISFLTEDNACTRFTTELVLRRQDTPAVNISINPGLARRASEKHPSAGFTVPVSFDKPDIETIIGEAKEAMGLSGAKMLSTDILRVELCGPTQPHLTVVDLPGLFRAHGRDQKARDAESVRALVRSYIQRPHSIILAVVSAENYSCLGDVSETVRELDPRGTRTLGLITKPDVLEAGSDREAVYAHLAGNTDPWPQLGWHVLKNRDRKVRDGAAVERGRDEERFFSRGVWSTIDPGYLGIKSLMPRLGNIVRNQMLQQVPGLMHDVDARMDMCRAQLKRLGQPRRTLAEQRRYLMQVSRAFTTLIKAAVDGEYSDAFFGSAKSDEGYRRRLRARVQNTLTGFEREMREKGQSRVIVDDAGGRDRKLPDDHQWRGAFVDEVVDVVRRSRARGLPGTFNFQIIRELFIEQCRPWKTIAANVKQEILGIVDDVALAVVEHVAVGETTRAMYYLVSGEVDKLKAELGAKFHEILRQYVDGHPITYNSYLMDMVQKEQERRTHEQLEETMKKIVGRDDFKEAHVKISPLGLYNSLKSSILVDMERSGAEMATDYMLAYYKLALEKFVDDIGVLAVEQCLLEKLPAVFLSEAVMDLQDQDVAYFVKERDPAPTERARCADRLKVLEAERRELARLDTRRSPHVAEAAGGNLAVASFPRSYTTDSMTADEAQPQDPVSPSLDEQVHSPHFVVEAEVAQVEAEVPVAVDEHEWALGHDENAAPVEDEPCASERPPEEAPEEPAAEVAEEAPADTPAEAESVWCEPEPVEAAPEECRPTMEATEEDTWGFKAAKKDKWCGSWGDASIDAEEEVPKSTKKAKKKKKSRVVKVEEAPSLPEAAPEPEPEVVPEPTTEQWDLAP